MCVCVCVCVCTGVCIGVCVCVSVIEKRICAPPPHMPISTMDRLRHWVQREVRGKLIDENLELEENKQDHH